MYLINTKRGAGKTRSLIIDSAKTGAIIIAATPVQATLISNRANDLGIEIPNPISAYDIVRGIAKNSHNDYLVDDFPQVMSILLSGNVLGATSTIKVLDIY